MVREISTLRTAGLALTVVLFCSAWSSAGTLEVSTGPSAAHHVARARDPENRCDLSDIFLRTMASGEPRRLESVARGREGSMPVRLSDPARTAVEYHFIGASRWLDRFEVVTDAALFSIEVLDRGGTWLSFGRDRGQGAETAVEVIGAPILAQAIRFRPLTPNAGEPVTLASIAAYFRQRDPDEIDVSGCDEGGTSEFHQEWVNDYTPHHGDNSADLSQCDDDATGLRDNLTAEGWVSYGHSNTGADVTHFESTSYGGSNGNHSDGVDFSYFSGHGKEDLTACGYTYKSSIHFGDSSDYDLSPCEASGAWGDCDAEWMAFSSCWMLESSSRSTWATALNGLHLICGASTLIDDDDYGTTFGNKLIDDGATDWAKTIKTSWFDALDSHNSDGTGVVVGETSSMGDDYIWGQGSVASDPTHNSTYHYWTYSLGGGSGPAQASARAPAPDRTLPADAVVFRASDSGGMQVLASPRVLTLSLPTQMPVYNVATPALLDSNDVRAIANEICGSEGVLCGGLIGPGDPGDLNLIGGAHELRVCRSTGAWQFEDTGHWMANVTEQPDLLQGGAAVARADQVLNGWALRPPGAFAEGVDYAIQAMATDDGMGDELVLAESTFTTATRVKYRRRVGGPSGYDVWGPGGFMSVALGEGGAVQRVFRGPWRSVTAGPMMDLAPIQDVLQDLSARGWRMLARRPRAHAESVVLDSAEAGYFDPACEAAPSQLRPMYRLHVRLMDDEGALGSRAYLYAWAEGGPPDVNIVSPVEGTVFLDGSTICFNGSATGGSPPYNFSWRDNRGRDLGSGPMVCAPFNIMANDVVEWDTIGAVQLIVRDQRGRESYDDVNVVLRSANTDVSGSGTGQGLRLSQSWPNPFTRSTSIEFELPAMMAGSKVTLDVFDQAGRRVRRLVSGWRSPGRSTATWDGRDESGARVRPGVYFYRLEVAGRVLTRRLSVLE